MTLEAIQLFAPEKETTMSSVKQLCSKDIAKIKARILRGDFQHRIAADYDLNQGRISEIATGKRFPWIAPAMEANNAEK